jgi:peptide deformylase
LPIGLSDRLRGGDRSVLLKIVHVGEPVLRQKAQPLAAAEISSNSTRKLIERMRETMRDAPGVGLAAPQIGVSLQIAVIEDLAEYHKDASREKLAERERKAVPFHVIINPKIRKTSPQKVEFYEGCLSLPGFSAMVPRAHHVSVECLDEHGKPKVIEASGWYARILQHEIDHLLGTRYIDRMNSRSFSSLDNFSRHWKDKSIKEARAALRLI